MTHSYYLLSLEKNMFNSEWYLNFKINIDFFNIVNKSVALF